MDFFFCDDASQSSPVRPGMGPVVAAGAIRISEDALKPLAAEIESLCQNAGFPDGEPFKWSPGRELWMHDHSYGEARFEFFAAVLTKAAEYEVQVIVVIEDTSCSRALAASVSAEDDVTALLLERAQWCLKGAGNAGRDRRPAGWPQSRRTRALPCEPP